MPLQGVVRWWQWLGYTPRVVNCCHEDSVSWFNLVWIVLWLFRLKFHLGVRFGIVGVELRWVLKDLLYSGHRASSTGA